jgi:hypothetical protein
LTKLRSGTDASELTAQKGGIYLSRQNRQRWIFRYNKLHGEVIAKCATDVSGVGESHL